MRAADEAEAAAQRAELEASTKNRAENVMIVDLVRNDLSRVCVPGSVSVPVLLGPEPHPGVWHLVSTVTGTLGPGAGDGDLIRAAFPPGSVTGAPKVRALEIIDELETAPREAYTGAIGYRSPVAGLELNVAIRTFEFAAGKAWIGAGGGIVADSDPAGEYAECLIKATPLLTALGARLDADALPVGGGAAGSTSAGRAALLPAPRGRGLHLASGHGRRNARPGRPPGPPGSQRPGPLRQGPARLPAADLAACLKARPSGRLRITVRPVGGPLQATVEVVPPSAPRAPVPGAAGPGGGPPGATAVTLRPVTVPGGVGAHKYRDRRLLAELARARRRRGRTGTCCSPTRPASPRDRPRQRVRGHGRRAAHPARRRPPAARHHARRGAARGPRPRHQGRPEAAHPRRGGQATEVFVTNAVAGVLPVTAIETVHRTWRPGPVTAALAAALAARPADAPSGPPAAPRLARPYAGAPGPRAVRVGAARRS